MDKLLRLERALIDARDEFGLDLSDFNRLLPVAMDVVVNGEMSEDDAVSTLASFVRSR